MENKMNFAEFEQYLAGNPDLSACRRLGSTHAAYGWSQVPWGHWTQEQKDAYSAGYKAENGMRVMEKCKGCGGPLDVVAVLYLARYPEDFETGILGECCAGRGGESDGWGDLDGTAPTEFDI